MYRAGVQHFTFIGTGQFSGIPGELRYEQTNAGTTVITGNINADLNPSFFVTLDGIHNLTASDFILS